MEISIIGWVWLGVMLGTLVGYTMAAYMYGNWNAELENENAHLLFVRDALKEEIFRIENQAKPKPRKKRNVRVKSIKVGE